MYEYEWPDECYQVKSLHVNDEIRVSNNSSVLERYRGARGKIVFINRARSQQIKVILRGVWTSHGVVAGKPSAWFGEPDLIKVATNAI